VGRLSTGPPGIRSVIGDSKPDGFGPGLRLTWHLVMKEELPFDSSILGNLVDSRRPKMVTEKSTAAYSILIVSLRLPYVPASTLSLVEDHAESR
jgi:hypothetical protein